MAKARVFSLASIPSLTDAQYDQVEKEWPLEKVILGETLKDNGWQIVKRSRSSGGRNVVVKCGYGIDELNLLSCLRNGGITWAPAPLAQYSVAGFYQVSVMEYVLGVPVTKERWNRFSGAAKQNFKAQLATKLIELRKITSESIQKPNGAALNNHYQYIPGTRAFTSEHEYNEMKLKALEISDEPQSKEFAQKLLEEHYEKRREYYTSEPSDEVFVMTHADLYPQNILIEDSDSGNVTAIIDFGNSAFYPAYMEYAFLMNGSQQKWWLRVMVEVMKIVLPDYNSDDPIMRLERLMNDMTNLHSDYQMKYTYGLVQFQPSNYEPNTSYCSVQ